MKIRIISHAIGAPSAKMWGDYWVLFHLQEAFRSLGHEVISQGNKTMVDLNVYLVGGIYGPEKRPPAKMHVAWFYSHIDSPTINFLNFFKFVMCLGLPYVETLKKQIKVPVVPLLGCTHVIPKMIVPPKTKDIVFCGNTRIPIAKLNNGTEYGRWIIDYLDPHKNKFKLEIYGLRWGNFPKAKPYQKGEFIDNRKLPEFYGSSKIALNDSHLDMRNAGFITIRTFDIVASGALCVSAHTKGLEDVFGDAVVYFDNTNDLVEKIKLYLSNDELRNEKIMKGMSIIRDKNMNYLSRAKQILEYYKQFGGK